MLMYGTAIIIVVKLLYGYCILQSLRANRRRYTVDTKNITLDDCFKLFTAEERLDGDNKPVRISTKLYLSSLSNHL